MKRKSVIVTIFIILCFTFYGCISKKQDSDTGKLKVIVTIYPLKEFAEAIGGDKVEVSLMVKEGIEPHEFDPQAKDLAELSNSKIFVYNGLGMETWLDKVLNTIQDKDKTHVVDSSKGVNEIKTDGKVDPHIWLSLKEAKVQALNIKNEFVDSDKENAAYYEENYSKLVKSIDDLINKNEKRFSELKNKDFVTGHAAFGYLCRDFGLEQRSVEDVFGEGEVTPQTLKVLIEFCKENKVKTVFMESLASPKVSETLAKEVDGRIEKIYTIESKEDGKSYIEAMDSNLDKIYDSLK